MLHRLAFGLRKKDTYEELINYLLNDQEKINYPNRYAKQLRESPYLTQLDGEGMGEMELQQENKIKEEQRTNTIRQAAATTNQSVSGIRAEMHHRETFSQASQATPATPDVIMTANDGSQTDKATYANAGTGSDDLPKPPPGGGRIQVDGGSQTSGLPPPEHYVHLHSHGGGPPPPPPDQARIRISTSDTGTPAPQAAASSSSGNPPPQPPGYGAAVRNKKIYNPYAKVAASSGNPVYFNIGDHPTPGRTALAHEQDTEMAQQQQWQDKEDKRAQNTSAIRQHLMETDNAPVQVKRSADAASRSVAQHMLDLNTQAANARRQRELQVRDDEKAIRLAMRQADTVEKRKLAEAKRAESESKKEQQASAKREKSQAKAEADAQKKQVEAQRAEIELQVENDKAIQEATKEDVVVKKNKKPPSASPKPKAKAKKSESVEPEHRSFSRATNFVSEPGSRSRSRTNGVILPTTEEVVKRGRGRPKSIVAINDSTETKPRGRPKNKSVEPEKEIEKRGRGRPRTKSVIVA